MDSHEGPARLEWWANRWTCLCSLSLHVSVRVEGGDWTCGGSFGPLTDDERDGFAFLTELDPVFTLVFAEDSTIPVRVTELGDGRLTLTEFEPPRPQVGQGPFGGGVLA